MGQGDVLSLNPAMLLVSWQFLMLDTLHPDIQKSAYYDDRNFRGCLEELIKVDKLVHEFDEAAGHSTQADKTAFICTSATDRKRLRAMTLQGVHPKVPQYTEIVGCLITASKRKICKVSTSRIGKAKDCILKIASAPVSAARKIRAFCAKVIPMATYGMQCASPTVTVSKKIRAKAMECLWGSSSKLRCVEVVLAILQDPTKVDHTFAAAYRSTWTLVGC